MTNYDIEHVIKKEMSGDVKDAFVAIGNCHVPGEGAGALLGLWAGPLKECGFSIILCCCYWELNTTSDYLPCQGVIVGGQPEDIFKAMEAMEAGLAHPRDRTRTQRRAVLCRTGVCLYTYIPHMRHTVYAHMYT